MLDDDPWSKPNRLMLVSLLLILLPCLILVLARQTTMPTHPPGWVATAPRTFHTVLLKGRWLVWDIYPGAAVPPATTPDPQLGAYDLNAQRPIAITTTIGTLINLVGDEMLFDRPTLTGPREHVRLNLATGVEQVVSDETEWARLTEKQWDFWTENSPAGCPVSTDCQDIYACGQELFAKNLLTGETRSLTTLGPSTQLGPSSPQLLILRSEWISACSIKASSSPINLIDLEAMEFRRIAQSWVSPGIGAVFVAVTGRTVAFNTDGKHMWVVRVLPQQPTQVLWASVGYAQGLVGENIVLYTPLPKRYWPDVGLAALNVETGEAQDFGLDYSVSRAGGDENHIFWIAAGHPQQLFVAPLHLQPPATLLFAGTPVPTFPPEFLEPRPLPVWMTATPWRATP